MAAPGGGAANPAAAVAALAAADAAREKKDTVDMQKCAPLFRWGKDNWDIFIRNFTIKARTYPDLTVQSLRRVLYGQIAEEGRYLIQNIDPDADGFAGMTFDQFSEHLRQVFEPEGESEQMRMEYRARYQLPGEPPEMYFVDKHRMFCRGFAAGTRDFEMFFEDVIRGLTNILMRDVLRNFRATYTEQGVEPFRQELIRATNYVRKKFSAGEISHAESLGSETVLTSNSYNRELRSGLSGFRIKNEPINALRGPTDKPCFYCGGVGHFIANCPRKTSGLGPAAAEVQDEEYDEGVEDPDAPDMVVVDGVEYLRNRFRSRRTWWPRSSTRGRGRAGASQPGPSAAQRAAKPGPSTTQGATHPTTTRGAQRSRPPFRRGRRIQYAYLDENGETQYEDILGPPQAGEEDEADEEAEEDEVHALQDQPELDDEDFIPAAFLGM